MGHALNYISYNFTLECRIDTGCDFHKPGMLWPVTNRFDTYSEYEVSFQSYRRLQKSGLESHYR